ncbi:MAG: hypothetical protein ILA34_07610 [Bacteroidaceae bacterium]|nr:hypothetical protein [Bacteroidaceae bacterium]
MVYYHSINQQDFSLAERENYRHVFLKRYQSEGASVLLQTCNRMELYGGAGEVPVNVARHLFRVVSGLESALVGERAVQGQVKDAYLQARQSQHLPAELHKLFEFALLTGKRVRNETQISHGAVSHSLAVIEIIEHEQIPLTDAVITIIGVNKLTEDILKFLKNKGARMVFLANRSEDKAHRLADPLGIEVLKLAEKRLFLPQTDILISATSAPHAIIRREDVHPAKKMLAIDLAFPRDIAPDMPPCVTLYNITDVERLVQQNIHVRQAEVAKAEEIIEEGIAELQDTLQRRKQWTQSRS